MLLTAAVLLTVGVRLVRRVRSRGEARSGAWMRDTARSGARYGTPGSKPVCREKLPIAIFCDLPILVIGSK